MRYKLEPQDYELIEHARDAINDVFSYREGPYQKHRVGAAVRTKSGEVFKGVHMEIENGRMTICAEPVAIGSAFTACYSELDTIVAVRHPNPHDENQELKVANPCGACRELIAEYNIKIIGINTDGELIKTDIGEFLPFRDRVES
ncbi:cytidine deaminase [bacterium]|nr:cytidine deaminase [bacterium]|tara:strand:+ start:2142 stop:2576 length:435 start_codon:yes stop_codon:yes gene_type:complete